MSSHEDQSEINSPRDGDDAGIPLAGGAEVSQSDPAGTPPGAGSGAGSPRGARVLCPYCGLVQPVTARCTGCKGLLDPESRQATQNAMGPWYVRNPAAAHHPGCSYATLKDLVRRGKVTRETILRGPTTAQFWNMAANTPGVAVMLGECHACHQPAREDEYLCRHCGVVLTPRTDRQHLGLTPVRSVGVPLSQPPVVSSVPVSALGVSTPVPMESFGGAPTAAASAPVLPQTTEPGLGLFGAEVILAKRRASDRRKRAALMLGAAAFALIAVVAVGVIVSRTKPARPAASTPGPSGVLTEGVPAAVPAPSAAERFADDLKDAARLTALGTATDLESAVRTLEGVRKLAASNPSPDKAFLAKLDETIEKTRVKLDDVRLNEALSGGGADAGTPPR